MSPNYSLLARSTALSSSPSGDSSPQATPILVSAIRPGISTEEVSSIKHHHINHRHTIQQLLDGSLITEKSNIVSQFKFTEALVGVFWGPYDRFSCKCCDVEACIAFIKNETTIDFDDCGIFRLFSSEVQGQETFNTAEDLLGWQFSSSSGHFFICFQSYP